MIGYELLKSGMNGAVSLLMGLHIYGVI